SIPGLLLIGHSKAPVSSAKSRVKVDGFSGLRDRRAIIALKEVGSCKMQIDHHRERMGFAAPLYLLSCVVQAPEGPQRRRIPIARVRIVRLQLQRAMEFLRRACPVPVVQSLDNPKRSMSGRQR